MSVCGTFHEQEVTQMIDTPHITQVPAQLTAIIRLTIPRGEMRQVMGPAFGELMAALNAQDIAPAGAWFTYHHRFDPATFDFEVGVPVRSAIAPTGRVTTGQLPAAKVARTVYHGGYEGLGSAWGEFDAWMKAEGHIPAQNFWEVYVAGPESDTDPAKWRTELNRPLAR